MGLAFFCIQYSNICDPKSYFSKKVIFLTESVAWLCAFPLKDCIIFEKSAVMVWNRPSMRIQFHKSIAPSANRFQHHFKLIKVHLYIYMCAHIYIPWCSFVIMAFFEVNVYNMYNYLEYIPSRKCIISLKRVQDFLRHQDIIPNFKMEFFCGYSVPFIKRVWYSLKKVWKVLFVFKSYQLLEGDAIFSKDNGKLFQHVILLDMQHSFWNNMVVPWWILGA